jgi:hypothetical protein
VIEEQQIAAVQQQQQLLLPAAASSESWAVTVPLPQTPQQIRTAAQDLY